MDKKSQEPQMIRWVIIVVSLSFSSALRAGDPVYMGWYSGVYYEDPSSDLVSIGASTALYYHQGYLTDEKVQARLDAALASGLRVIMDINGIVAGPHDITAVDVGVLQAYISKFKDHPAVVGWYISDEPDMTSSNLNFLQTAYNTIKAVDTVNPVHLAHNHSDNNAISYFSSVYDVLIYDQYPFAQGESECYRIEDHGMLWWYQSGLRTMLSDAASKAAAVNKPWVYASQGFGRTSGYEARLPTNREHRWGVYYAYLTGAEGVLTWEYTSSQDSAADSGDPYPYSGQQWDTEVYAQTANEIAVIGAALTAGAENIHLSDNQSAILSSLYQDPETGKYYLVALSNDDGSYSPMFSLTLPKELTMAIPLDGSGPIPITNGQFSDYFAGYDVIVYELVPEPATLTLWALIGPIFLRHKRSRFLEKRNR